LRFYQLIHQFAERQGAALVISSDLEELIPICDRLLVMSLGRITGEFARQEFDRQAILAAAFARHLRTAEAAE
jgi:ABC-type sugar transport system ATPase subunit